MEVENTPVAIAENESMNARDGRKVLEKKEMSCAPKNKRNQKYCRSVGCLPNCTRNKSPDVVL